MYCKLPREIVIPKSAAAVTITGSGIGTSYAGSVECCSATIAGTKYTDATTLAVMLGDVITFSVKGYSSSRKGTLIIDGTEVLSVTTNTTTTYSWTVPNNVSTVTIVLATGGSTTQRIGTITVTTT